MKLNIHPEFQRAMQAARQEEISRAAARQRAEETPDRSAWAVRLVRGRHCWSCSRPLGVRREGSGVNAYRPSANLPSRDDI